MPSRAAVRRDGSQGGGGAHSGAIGDDDNAARRPSGSRAAGWMIYGACPGRVGRRDNMTAEVPRGRGAHARTASSLRLVWVYPDLLSTYGDRGNLLILQRR